MSESAGKASVLNMGFSLVNLVAGILVNVAIARLLGPTAKGTLSVFQAAQGILMVAGCSAQQGVVRCVAAQRPPWPVLRPALALFAFVQAVVLVGTLGLIIQHPGARRVLFTGLPNVYLILMFLAVCGSIWSYFRAAVVTGLQRFQLDAKVAFLAATTNNVVQVTGLILLHFCGMINATTVLIASLIASVGSNVIIWATVTQDIDIPESHPASVPGIIKGIVRDTGPMYLRDMLEWANYRVDVFFVNGFLGPQQVGLYTVAVGLAMQTMQVAGAMMGPLFGRVARDGETPESLALLQFSYRITLALSVCIALAVLFAVPVLLPLVYGNRYAPSVPLLILLLPGSILIAPTRVAVTYLRAQGKLAAPIRAEMAGLVLTALLDSTLIPRFGPMGASIASTCSYAGLSLVLAVQFMQMSGSKPSDLFLPRVADFQRVLNVLKSFSRPKAA